MKEIRITKLQDVNTALLAILSWRIIIAPGNLWVNVVFAKYLPKDNFHEKKKSANISTM